MKRIASAAKTRLPKLSQGYILYENDSIVVIATGITRKSTNKKTGAMIQIYILVRHTHPVEAVKLGLDRAICIDCIHMGTEGFKERSCYVDMKGPIAVWEAYQRGSYPHITEELYARVFTNRAVRFGTYGEPCLIPLGIIRRIVRVCNRHSGYTHQWANGIDGEYLQYLMASCDRPGDADKAHALGFRTFRVEPTHGASPLPGEIMCPSESRGHNCVDCKLCNGAVSGAKSVMITVHGAGARHLQTKLDRLIQIEGFAA